MRVDFIKMSMYSRLANKDMTFWLKWLATTILVLGTGVTSLGFYPTGPAISVVGGFVWLVVAIRWKEPALIVTNVIMSVTAIAGISYHYLYL
jgi:hypothetical protein